MSERDISVSERDISLSERDISLSEIIYIWNIEYMYGVYIYIYSGCICNTFDKFCVTGGRSRRGFLLSSKTPSYIFECIQVLCYRRTLP